MRLHGLGSKFRNKQRKEITKALELYATGNISFQDKCNKDAETNFAKEATKRT